MRSRWPHSAVQNPISRVAEFLAFECRRFEVNVDPAINAPEVGFHLFSASSGIPASDRLHLLTRIVALPFCNLRLKAEKPRSKSYPQNVLSIGDAIRARRLDLGLRQKDIARILGCDKDTITNWENGHRSPTISHTAKIVELLGYNSFSAEGATLSSSS